VGGGQGVKGGHQRKATAADADATAATTATSSTGVLDWILNDYELDERTYEQLDKVKKMRNFCSHVLKQKFMMEDLNTCVVFAALPSFCMQVERNKNTKR